MHKNERFLRGKSRLIEREHKLDEDKKLFKKLGKISPEDTISPPVIGEWSLNPEVKTNTPQLVDHLRAQTSMKQTRIIYPSAAQTPESYQPHEREKERTQMILEFDTTGAFNGAKFQVKMALEFLCSYEPKQSGMINFIKYSSKHFDAPNTDPKIKGLLGAQV